MLFQQSGPPDSNGNYYVSIPERGSIVVQYLLGLYQVTIPAGVTLGGIHSHIVALSLSDGALLQHIVLKAAYGNTGTGGITPYVLDGRKIFVPFTNGSLKISSFPGGFLTSTSACYFVVGYEVEK